MADVNITHIENINEPTHIVGIGASAGGLEAVQTLVSNLSSNTNIAYIIVQHLSPDYKSLMTELLSKYTKMPIVKIEDGISINSNTIYLIPPRKNIKIFHQKFISVDQKETNKANVNLPIDILFQSMAEDIGDKAIGIVLSGTGCDGTRGIRVIKECGGMTVAQSPETAQFSSMPENAIATGLVDYILSPEMISMKLSNYVNHPFAHRSEELFILETDHELAKIFSLLREKHKVDFTHYKPSTIIRRIERRITINQCQNIQDYKAFIDLNPKEITRLFQEMLIGVTSFFRDDAVFDAIEQNVLPEIFSPYTELKAPEEFRVWVAGCSTGEEAYSIAILCHDYINKHKLKIKMKLFATDIDSQAIERASMGIYSNSIAADILPKHLTKYFVNHDDHYQIHHAIRESVVFAQHDLTRDPPFINIDLITCRNLMIYLQPILQKKVLELFNFSLKKTGMLVLGSSETINGCEELFEAVLPKLKIYKTKGKQHLTHFSQNIGISGSTKRFAPTISPIAREHESIQRLAEDRFFDRFIQSLSEYDVIPLTLVVDELLNVSHIYGDSDQFLHYSRGKVILELSKIVIKELSVPVTTAVQKSIKTQKLVSLTNIKLRFSANEVQVVDVKVIPMPARGNQESLYALLIRKETTTNDDGHLSLNYNIGLDAEQRIVDLEQELQFSRESLQATVEELETSNEELQATNEELLASNEEFQSTNEELQSVNEELYTVNAEYQSKITELTTLNTDMDNLFESTHTAALFLDENVEIRRFTPRLSEIFPILKSDIGRPIDHLVMDVGGGIDCHKVVKKVIRDGIMQEHEIQTDNGKWCLLRVSPYAISRNVQAGAVLTILDIDELKRVQGDLLIQTKTKAHRLAHIINTSDLVYIQWRPDGKILLWSKGAQKLYGWSESQALKMNIYEMIVHTDKPELESAIESLQDLTSVDISINKISNTSETIPVQMHISANVEVNGEMLITSREVPCSVARYNINNFIHDVVNEAYINKCAILINSQGLITNTNDTFLQLIGISKREAMGKTLFDLLKNNKIKFNQLKELLSTSPVFEIELELNNNDQQTINKLFTGKKLFIDSAEESIILIEKIKL